MAELSTISLYSDGNLQENYKLEDLTGKNGNTLTNNNTVAFNTAKYSKGADGGASNTNKYLSIANALAYAGGAYAISFWIKLSAEITSSEWWFIHLGETTNDTSIAVSYEYNSGTIRTRFNRIRHGVAVDSFVVNGALGTSSWHHIVITYNATTVRGYIDNADVGTVASSGNGSSNISNVFSILADRNNTLNASAIIDDVSLFNRNLTSGEVAAIYQDSIAYTKSFSETITPSDTMARAFTRIFTDLPIISDSISKGRNKLFSDITTIADKLLGKKAKGSGFSKETPTLGNNWTRRT